MDIDIRTENYREALSSYLEDASGKIVMVGDPVEEVTRHGLTGRENVNPADYPTGTWFYFPGDGQTYVREA